MIQFRKSLTILDLMCRCIVCSTILACSATDRASTEEGKKALKEAKVLTEQGYDLKQVGNNREAISKFELAQKILEPALGKVSAPVASSIDDIATVHMRTGNYKTARKLYLEAIEILEKCDPPDVRLTSSTIRRLATLEALQSQNITCNEPMEPSVLTGANQGDAQLPYAPITEDVLKVFGKMNPHLSSCVTGPKMAVTTWVVLSGNGQIIRAEVRSNLRGTKAADCIEKRIVSLSSEMSPLFPRFRACFKNFNYPFLLGN